MTVSPLCILSVLFVGKQLNIGSFLMRGHELSTGMQLIGGARTTVQGLHDFVQGNHTGKSYDFIVFVKYAAVGKVLQKARQIATYVLFDSIDKYKRVPRVDVLLVNTIAQKVYYHSVLGNVTTFVLPHHVSNFRAQRRMRGEMFTKLLIVGTKPPKHLLRIVNDWGRKNNISIHTNSRVSKSGPFNQSDSWCKLYANYDVLLVWGYQDRAKFCFRAATRLTQALAVGVPVIVHNTEGFLEAVHGFRPPYPFVVDNADQLESVLLLAENRTIRGAAVAIGLKIAARFALQNIASSACKFFCSVLHKKAIFQSHFDTGAVLNPLCSVNALRKKNIRIKYVD